MNINTRYEEKKARVITAFKASKDARTSGQMITLGKETSNLFRARTAVPRMRLPVKEFNEVLSVDAEKLEAEVEGMTPYETLVAETLRHGLLPTVVPELKSITIGGATTGIGIESSSFRYGLVHETVKAMDILLGDGRVVTATRDNEYQDLFRGFPNSYGTFGYVLKLTVSLVRAKKYVKLEHVHFSEAKKFFEAIEKLCGNGSMSQSDGTPSHSPYKGEKKGVPPLVGEVRWGTATEKKNFDFIDGVVFSEKEFVITLGTFVDDATWVSDYTGKNIYYKSIRTKEIDYLSTKDYIWRWDTDWFWCSMHFGVQNRLLRALIPKKYLRSTTYWKIRSWLQQHQTIGTIVARGKKSEPVVQDVEIPIQNAEAFLKFFQKEIGITPIWVCPVKAKYPSITYDLYTLRPGTLYINFGFWDTVASDKPDGHYNRLIEKKVAELGGKKSLYSTSYYSEAEFWQLYNKPAYDALKQKYDPNHTFKNLYDKCVRQI